MFFAIIKLANALPAKIGGADRRMRLRRRYADTLDGAGAASLHCTPEKEPNDMTTEKKTFSTCRRKIQRFSKALMIGSLAGALCIPSILLQTVYGSRHHNGAMNPRPNTVKAQQPVSETPIKRGNRALIDRQLRSIKGETIGEIENVIIDGTGQVKYVIASIEGWWGMGSKEAMVPIDRLNITRHRDYVYYEGTEEEMEMYPNYSDYGWAERRYGSTANTWFNRQKNLSDDQKTTDTGRVEKRPGNPMLHPDRGEFGSRGIQASQLIDKQVRNSKGEILGEVDDVVITPTGDIRLLVFIGQALDMQDKKVQADLEDIAIREDADYLLYDVSKEELKKDPRYLPD